MKKLLLLTLLCLVCGAAQSVFAQKLEDNCSTEAFITDKDPNGLNVRDLPNVKGKVIATLKQNIKEEDFIVLYITGYSNGWAKIGSAEKVDSSGELLPNGGWVSAKMVGVATKGTNNYDAPAPFYEKTSKSSRKIGTIPSGTTVQMLGFDCFGLKVSYKGKTGWLSFENICGNPVTNCS